MKPPKVILVTVYSQGPPHDQGGDLTQVEKGFREHVEPYVDLYVSYSPERLVSENPAAAHSVADYTTYLQNHPNLGQLGNYKISWSRLGFIMYKPYVIRHVISSSLMEPGDILLYHDVDYETYPVYIQGCEQWKSLSFEILSSLNSDFFIPLGGTLEHDVKSCLIRKHLGESFFKARGVWNGLMIFRKTDISSRFIEEWVSLSSDLDNISPLPNPDPRPKFMWHSVDQSVAGVLARRWVNEGLLPAGWFRYELRGRCFSKENLIDTLHFTYPLTSLLAKIFRRCLQIWWRICRLSKTNHK
jgi:hypothetical protein